MCEYKYKPEKVVKKGEQVFDEIENLEVTIRKMTLDLKAIQEQIIRNNEMINELEKKIGELNGVY